MTKHPNAPAEKREKRKKQAPINVEEYDEIHRLWESGMTKTEISMAMRRSPGAIVTAISKLSREDVLKRMELESSSNHISKYSLKDREVSDLSKVPDGVYFEHSKAYAF